ncbi:MAG: hypothetical protein WBD27_02235 [Pyrinomonadaceae bacterium]
MRKTIFSRITTLGICVAFVIIALAASVSAQSDDSGNLKISILPVRVIATGAKVPQSGSSLARNSKSVLATISTSGLTPGHVTTFWLTIFNNPEFCATVTCSPPDLNNPAVNGSLQFGGGTIADAGGKAIFSAFLAVGDNTGFYLNPAFPNMQDPSPGIADTKKAQIHLAIRTHGVPNADPAVFAQQLTSFPGGCSVVPNPCATIQVSPFLP